MTVVTESFNKADNAALGVDNTWTDAAGDFQNVSNQGRPTTIGGSVLVAARCETDVGSTNMSVQAEIPVLTRSSVPSIGIAARFADAADTFYDLHVDKFDTGVNGEWYLQSVSAGVETTIAGPTAYTWTSSDVLRLTCVGTTITAYINGAQVAQVTNSAISTGTKAGVDGYRLLSGDDSRVDNWRAEPTSITLSDAKGTAASAGTGDIRLAADLQAHGDASTTGAADITVTSSGVVVDGKGTAASAGTADLRLAADLQAHGDAASGSTADALLAADLKGAGHAASGSTADLVLAVNLQGRGDAASAGTADLVVTLDLQGAGTAASTGTGNLVVTLDLQGHGDACSAGSGDLIVSIDLAGHGDASSSGSLTLDSTGTAVVEEGGGYSRPRARLAVIQVRFTNRVRLTVNIEVTVQHRGTMRHRMRQQPSTCVRRATRHQGFPNVRVRSGLERRSHIANTSSHHIRVLNEADRLRDDMQALLTLLR